MSDWYWRDGTPAVTADITSKQWIVQMGKVEKKLRDRNYKIVKQETTWLGFWVSTVWLGLNHRFGDGTPLIFETMVFIKGNWSELDMDRYSTLAEAKAGHRKMVRRWSNPFYIAYRWIERQTWGWKWRIRLIFAKK